MTQSPNLKLQIEELSGLFFKRDSEINRIRHEWNEALLARPLELIIDFWIEQVTEKKKLSKETAHNYQRYLKDLRAKGILPKNVEDGSPFTLEVFKSNSQTVFKALLNYPDLTQQEKRFRLNALTSFVNFLNEITTGVIRKLSIPKELELKKTVRSTAPRVLTLTEWHQFWTALEKISFRDCLIAKIMHFTARPLLRVLELKTTNLKYEANVQVTFNKTDGRDCVIQLDSKMKDDLEKYLESTKSARLGNDQTLFITSQGKPIYRTHLTQVFKRASLEADLGFFVSAKMIQWSHVYDMLNRMNFSKALITEKLKLKNLSKHLEV